MRITSSDILSFSYCPYSWKNKIKTPSSFRRFTTYEACVIKSILEAEKACLIQERLVDNRKINRKWDNIFWPKTAEIKMPMEEANKLSIKASMLFTDYCRYDFTNSDNPTVGVGFSSELYENEAILVSSADILKVDLSIKNNNLTVIGFGNKKLSQRELFVNPFVWLTISPLYTKQKETIKYIYVGILEGKENLYVATCQFRYEELLKIKKYIKYYCDGIKQNIDYMNLARCEECKQCSSFKF